MQSWSRNTSRGAGDEIKDVGLGLKHHRAGAEITTVVLELEYGPWAWG